MKRIISLLLAVMLIASVAAISAGAEDVAKVTVTSIDGKSETKTYAVGDTFTVYTTLNASSLDGGKIAAMKGEQEYTDSVLEIVDEADADGLVIDNDKVFPIAGDKAMGNVAVKGTFHFTLSNPSMSKPFVFDSDSSKLVVVTYKVIAAGDASIKTTITTLAQSDLYLTKIINNGEYTDPSYSVDLHSSYRDPDDPAVDVTISGSITSYLDDSDVTVTLTGDDNNLIAEVNGVSDYSIVDVPAGEYTLSVSKANHVTRDYTVSVADEDVTVDVKICPLGDIDGNGTTNVLDCSVALRYIRNLRTLDDYQIKCGDVFGSGDGKVDVNDVARILRHVRNLKTLY